MQDITAERAFYSDLFGRNPDNEHITGGYEELHALALPHAPAGPILDLGCGTGAHTVRLARRGYDLIAVDLTREGVRAARTRLAGEGLSGRFVVADAERLPFRDAAASVTWSFLLLHHFPQLDTLPAEVARVTRSKIVALEPSAYNLLTWFANNVLNRFIGLSSMTKNQRALKPATVCAAFAVHGFRQDRLYYIQRNWSDQLTWLRRAYGLVTRRLPLRFRANKFLITLVKAEP